MKCVTRFAILGCIFCDYGIAAKTAEKKEVPYASEDP
jgi:hypothetical protein